MAYARLLNALSQIYKRLIPGESWNNISDRGINKAIPPVIKRGGKIDTDIQFPFEWEDKHSGKACFITGHWNAKHFMVMDLLGHIFLLKTGGNRLPREVSPIFEDLESIQTRENEINQDVDKQIPPKVTQ